MEACTLKRIWGPHLCRLYLRNLFSPPQVIMEAWVKGVNPKGNSTNPSNWDFGSSFFFAGTVVTTIGKRVGMHQKCPTTWVPAWAPQAETKTWLS